MSVKLDTLCNMLVQKMVSNVAEYRPEGRISDVRVVAKTTSDTSHQGLRVQCDKCRSFPQRGQETGAR